MADLTPSTERSSGPVAGPGRPRALLGVVIGAAIVLVGLSLPAAAQFQTVAKRAILIDMDTGAVLYQKNADELFPPASMSKLMTLAVVFKALKDGQLKPDDEFRISENAWRTGGGPSGTAAMFLTLNSKEKLSEILQGIIVQSGNDACIVVAEGMAGSEEAFAKLMTDYARRIGMKKTTFGNSTGLPHPDQRSTAREIAMLAMHLIKAYPDYYRYFSQKRYNYKKYRFLNRNPLVYLDLGVDGLKTGYTKESGYGLVASGAKNGRRLIFVVAGLKSKKQRKAEGQRLYEWGLTGFKEFKLFEPNETVAHARIWGGSSFYVPLVGNGPVRVLLPKFSTSRSKLRASVVYEGPLKPPIRQGEQVAVLRVSASQDGESEVPLYAAEDVARGSIFMRGFDSLLHLAFSWLP